jgi:hypothetical protein
MVQEMQNNDHLLCGEKKERGGRNECQARGRRCGGRRSASPNAGRQAAKELTDGIEQHDGLENKSCAAKMRSSDWRWMQRALRLKLRAVATRSTQRLCDVPVACRCCCPLTSIPGANRP